MRNANQHVQYGIIRRVKDRTYRLYPVALPNRDTGWKVSINGICVDPPTSRIDAEILFNALTAQRQDS